MATALGLLCLSAWAGKPTPPALSNSALFYSVNDAGIIMSSSDGDVRQEVVRAPRYTKVQRRSPVWSRDGSVIAYLETEDSSTRPSGVDRIYLIQGDGSGPVVAHEFSAETYVERIHGIGLLPGGYVHFTGATGPEILDLHNGAIQSLGLNMIHKWAGGPSSFGPTVDPSIPGSMGLVAYIAYDEDGDSIVGPDLHLAVIGIADDGSILVDPNTITRLDLPGNQNFPVISPDGQQVVFYDDAHGDSGDTLAIVEIVYGENIRFGAVNTLLVGGFGEFRVRPAWSPDSRWIAFTWAPDINPNRRDPFEIARIRPDGSGFANVTGSSSHEVYSAWNPLWINDIDP